MIVSEISTKERNERRSTALKQWEHGTLFGQLIERMVGSVTGKQRDLQILLVRGIVFCVLPVCLVLATVDYATSKTVNPVLSQAVTSILIVMATLLQVNKPDDKPKG